MAFYSPLAGTPGRLSIGFKNYASGNTGSPALATLLLLLLNFVSDVWKSEQFSLFTSTVTWGILWAVCSRISTGRYSRVSGNGRRKRAFSFGGVGGIRGGSVMLVSSLLLTGVCDRASGVRSPWAKAGIPAATYLIRRSERADSHGEMPVRGMRRVMLFLTAAATIALQPAFVSNSTLALGICSGIFSALSLVLLEQSLLDLAEVGTRSNAATLRPEWDGDETWRTCIILGQEVGMYLFFGFASTSLVFESFPLRVLVNMGTYDNKAIVLVKAGWLSTKLTGIGLLGAIKWATVSFVINRFTAVNVGLLELTTTLLTGILSISSGVRLLGVVGAFVGMSGYTAAQPGVDWVGGFLPNVCFRTRSTQLSTVLLLLVLGSGMFLFSNYHSHPIPKSSTAPIIVSGHPIPKLIADAEARHRAITSRQSKSLPEAIAEYRRRYGMKPPPNFDRWYEYAKNRNSVLIDEYDTIYHLLKPFWGLPPTEIRKRIREAIGFDDPIGLQDNKLLHVAIRNGAVNIGGQGSDWQIDATREMVGKFVSFLPDMDVGFNIHDEPRIVVPNDMLNQYLARAEQILSQLGNNDQAKNEFTPLSDADRAPVSDFPRTVFNVFAHQPTWNSARQSCPADSPAKSVDLHPADTTSLFSVQPLGFIFNATEASNICLSPSLSRRHGFFDRPNAFNIAQSLVPIFSQSKVSSFSDILYPSPWYWAGKVAYDQSKDIDWEKKNPSLYWRGSTTGGFSRNGGWRRQHRQRLVTVINKNDTAKILTQDHRGETTEWNVQEVKRDSLAQLFDVHFSHVGQCDPEDCDAQREFFGIAPTANQDDAWQWKYLLDMDGNAFSGRYYAFLESQSAVFKQAVFREWHEEWIKPWVHYVPVSMEMEELAELVRYFDKEEEGRRSIKKIAEESRDWAKRVLRKEDFEVWFFRVLLEYGRVIDDNRETIGYLG